MTKVLFVCHGNICRSPMAEFILRDMIAKRRLEGRFLVRSAATSAEEIGNPVHYGTKRLLTEHGIDCSQRRAICLCADDYERYDYIIGMDSQNLRDMMTLFDGDPDGKLHLLLDFTDEPRDVADPWYTGDFETTYDDVSRGCEAFLNKVVESR